MKGCEFYTPTEVVELLLLLIDPKEGMSILDPTVCSGRMLIRSKKYVQDSGGVPRNLELAGQEHAGERQEDRPDVCAVHGGVSRSNPFGSKLAPTLAAFHQLLFISFPLSPARILCSVLNGNGHAAAPERPVCVAGLVSDGPQPDAVVTR